MGSECYYYYVPYENDKNNALQKLREREFGAGRYNPAMSFPFSSDDQPPGKQHATIEDAIRAAEEDGTRSILDLVGVSGDDYFCTARVPGTDELNQYFGTDKPTKALVEEHFNDFAAKIERGKGLCITVYEGDKPDELFFVGYSFD
ncbi:hypothetical protein FACS1894164_09440 [Spirochaetia bacterium]|nr:hypothetical protein FACS1894164_09440 [Spirochaetia bacterium]